VLERIADSGDENVLVGFDTSDDAGVYRLSPDQALVQTVDFIPPPVNDAKVFGQIAAANSLSDVYAMGGKPLTALNLVCFPDEDLSHDLLHGLIEGGAQKVTEAGAVILGGHTIRDTEPKYGLSVTGLVHPDKIWRNGGARPGDALILTKAIGTGVLFNANKKSPLAPEEYVAMITGASRLNKYAAEALVDFDVHACTDVTGFGLAGHAMEMSQGISLQLEADRVPVLQGARAAYEAGFRTGANRPNRENCGVRVTFETALSDLEQELYFDPQTSGGLLVAVPAEQVEDALVAIHGGGDQLACQIGCVTSGDGVHIV
jgi:selenide,water dikinase